MLGLVDGKILRYSVLVGRVGILPARFHLLHRDGVGPVAVYLISRHVNERRFGAGTPGGLQQVQSPQRIDLEVEERNGGGAIVRRLGGGVNNEVRPKFLDQGQHPVPVADIERGMAVAGHLAPQSFEDPTGIAFGTEEDSAMIAVDAGHAEALTGEEDGDLRADQATGSRHQDGWAVHECRL